MHKSIDAGRATHSPYRKTDRRIAALPATLLREPITIAEFWKNRKGDTIRITLESYEGHDLASVRQFFTTPDGKLAPTKKGVSVSILRLPELAAALNKALEKARELGLISGGTE